MFEHAPHFDTQETAEPIIAQPSASSSDIKTSLEQRHRSISETLSRANTHFSETPTINAEKIAHLKKCIESLNTLIGERTHEEIEGLPDEDQENLRTRVQELMASTEELPNEVLHVVDTIRLPELRFSVFRNAINQIWQKSNSTVAKAMFEQQRLRMNDGTALAANTLNDIGAKFKQEEETIKQREDEVKAAHTQEENLKLGIETKKKDAEAYEAARAEIEMLTLLFTQAPLRTLTEMRVSKTTERLFLANLPEVVHPLLEAGRFDDIFAVLKLPNTQQKELQKTVLEDMARTLIQKDLASPGSNDSSHVKELLALGSCDLINKSLLHALVWSIPGSVEGIDEQTIKPENKIAFAHALSETFYPQASSAAYLNYSDPLIEKGLAARKKLVSLLTSLPAGAERDAQLKNATEFCLDPDLGNLEDAATIANLHSIQSEREKLLALIPAELNQWESLKSKHMETWEKRSQENKQTIESDLIDLFGAERVAETIKSIESTSFITINASPSSIQHILDTGSIKSAFDDDASASKRDYSYQRVRHRVEKSLGIRAKGTEKDPHPIYGALGYANGQDEYLGAAPAYGDCAIRLKASAKERSVYTYGDSFGSDTEQRQFVSKDAAYAKAKLDLDGREANGTKTPYVEAQIIGGVHVEDIEEIHIRHQTDHTLFEAYAKRFPQIKFIYHEASV